MLPKNLSIYNTFIHKDAQNYVSKVLQSTFISEGDLVKTFEENLALQFGLINPVALNSGTTALHLALDLFNIGEGDEVIIPAQTFVATGLVVLQQKATPIFADIDYNTGNISVDSIKQKITNKTKAIIPVHWGGYPCDLEEINGLAKQYNIVVVEDAAHALGAIYKNKKIGSISDVTCFSFQAIKHLTTGDGGAISFLDKEKYTQAFSKRWFGINRHSATPTELGERAYNITEPGYKYHLNDYAAALGLANMQNFKQRLIHRINLANFYDTHLNNINGIRLFNYKSDRKSAYWLYGFHVEKRLDFVRALKANGITASVIHQRIDRNTVFGGLTNDLINQEKFDLTQIHIPMHDAVSMDNAAYIVSVIKKGW